MNKAITDGLVLMPPPFSAGLNLWSQGDGTPGSSSYAAVPGAAVVPADQDFGSCLELQKTQTTQKLRSYQQIPFQPGMYLRVTARIKAVLGNLPAVRIAAWAGASNGSNLGSLPQTGPSVTLTAYGSVVTVQAIIGSGSRTGVDLVWGTQPAYAHVGLDLTGANGGVVRIDDIEVEDVTSVFHRNLMDWVDVRDYGARGDGVTDDRNAFAAADAAAEGRRVLVSAGTYFLGANTTFNSPVRFEGRLSMAASSRLVCTRNFDLETYSAAFGGETEGFRRGLQALFQFTDHIAFDLSGRRVSVDAPIDVAAVAGVSSLALRRLIQNGSLEAANTTAWASETVTSVGTYTTSAATTLTGVANVANIPVGARVTGTGVGREVYVRSRNIGAGTIELSVPLWQSGNRTFTFTRDRYILDFSGFSSLSRFEMMQIEFFCDGRASAVMLPPAGTITVFSDCVFNRPKDRAITSIGTGCQGLIVDQCQFLSNEQAVRAQDRTSIVLNTNANDVKLRHNRVARFAHFAVLAGDGTMVLGNHFFHGDDEAVGVRRAGLIFTTTNIKTFVTGNYIDNGFIEWTNEHDNTPDFANELSFGGLTITGNIFMASNTTPAFCWIVVTPYGSGQFINGLSVTDNAFRTVNGSVDRIEMVDTTYATLDFGRMRNITFTGNAFHGVNQMTQSPVMIEHVQNTAAETWVLDAGAFLPFGGRARNLQSLVAEGAITTSGNSTVWTMPYAVVEQGTNARQVQLRWSSAVRGRVQATIRVDNPN